MNQVLAWLVPPLVALVVSVVCCMVAIRLAARLRFTDRPGAEPHKQQGQVVPYGGGIAMAIAVVLALVAAHYMSVTPMSATDAPKLLPIVFGALAMVIMGAWDDARPLRPWLKLAVQAIICSAVISPADLAVDCLRGWSPALAWTMAFGWLIVVSNAYNLLDHADGLAGAVAAVSCAALAGGAIMSGDVESARLWLTLAAALAGFLVWNRPPARLYMGDSGSLAIGFLIGCGTLQTTFWPSGEGGSSLGLISPLLICFIPLFDTAAVVVKRVRRGHPIMRGDRHHISHRLARLGLSPSAVLAAVVALQIALAAASFQLRNTDWISGSVVLAQAAAIAIALVLLETARDHG
ncbi:MAG: MraY family glycosyltransferase [Planctomycetota bacterium]